MVYTPISIESWSDKYRPLKNTLVSDAPFNGCMFETFGEELELIAMYMNNRQIWTLVNGDDGNDYVIPGYHYVNRIGYFLTENEWENEDVEVIIPYVN